MEKTTYTTVKQVEMMAVLPRTVVIEPEKMNMPNVEAVMHVVYGKDAAERKVWLATFMDRQEAEAWVYASKTFGRPVRGAVIAGQGELIQGGEISDDATVVEGGDDSSGPAGLPN